RAGSSRRTVIAVMRAALSAWSASSRWRVPSMWTAQVELARSGTSQVSAAATAPTDTPRTRSTTRVPRSALRMERVVERDAVPAARQGLDGPGLGVAAQQQVGAPGQLACGNHGGRRSSGGRLSHGDLGAGRDVQSGLHDAVVAQRDAYPAVGAQQAALTDADPFGSAAGEGAH